MSALVGKIQQLRDADLMLRLDGTKLRVEPVELISKDMHAWLSRHGKEVVAFLQAEQAEGRAPEPNAQGPPVRAQTNGHSANGHVPPAAIATHGQETDKAEKGFTAVPNWVFGVPAAKQLGASSTVVFFHVLRWTLGFHQLWCTQGVESLAEECGLGRSTVQRALVELQAKGVITRTVQKSDGGQTKQSRITLVIADAARLGVSK